MTFVADRNERRNITKSQKAMAYAMLFPEAKIAGDRKSSRSSPAARLDFSKQLLSQARFVLAHSDALACRVRDGTMRSRPQARAPGAKSRVLEPSMENANESPAGSLRSWQLGP